MCRNATDVAMEGDVEQVEKCRFFFLARCFLKTKMSKYIGLKTFFETVIITLDLNVSHVVLE